MVVPGQGRRGGRGRCLVVVLRGLFLLLGSGEDRTAEIEGSEDSKDMVLGRSRRERGFRMRLHAEDRQHWGLGFVG